MRSVLRTGILLMLRVLELDISLLREYVQHGSGHHSAPLLQICSLKGPVKWQKSNVAIHAALLGCFILFSWWMTVTSDSCPEVKLFLGEEQEIGQRLR